jgi:formimidoylglutamate deiminase
VSETVVYQPDLLYTGGRFHEGRALGMSADGLVLHEGPVPAGARTIRLPGLVNGHSHAFQRLIRGRTEYVASGREADDFWGWQDGRHPLAEESGRAFHALSRSLYP